MNKHKDVDTRIIVPDSMYADMVHYNKMTKRMHKAVVTPSMESLLYNDSGTLLYLKIHDVTVYRVLKFLTRELIYSNIPYLIIFKSFIDLINKDTDVHSNCITMYITDRYYGFNDEFPANKKDSMSRYWLHSLNITFIISLKSLIDAFNEPTNNIEIMALAEDVHLVMDFISAIEVNNSNINPLVCLQHKRFKKLCHILGGEDFPLQK